jgi:hypothetical protein
MKAGKLVCGLLAIHVMGAVALGLLVWRSASQPVPQRVLTSTEQIVVARSTERGRWWDGDSTPRPPRAARRQCAPKYPPSPNGTSARLGASASLRLLDGGRSEHGEP